MTTRIIQSQADEIIVDVSNEIPAWYQWHQLVSRLIQYAVRAQQAIKLILILNQESDDLFIVGETMDYLLNPEIFKEIVLVGNVEHTELIQSLIGIINSETSIKISYLPFDEVQFS